MAGITHTVTRTYNTGTRRLGGDVAETAGQENNLDESLPIFANTPVAFAFVKTKLKSICIVADQACDIYTNQASTGTPQEHLAILADQPYIWTAADAYFANPFAGDVTSIFVTCAAITRLQIASIIDPT